MIRMNDDNINKADIDRLVVWLKSYPRLTKGPVTIELENRWSRWFGKKHSLFVNSGSSANLLMIYSLVVANRLKNDKVVIPGLSWSTDLAPVMQVGLTPILCDCNLENLSVSLDHLAEIFERDNPAVLMLVSVLGFSPDMDAICRLCREYDVILLEDACEAIGTRHRGREIGTFGEMSSFSMHFGHHISTIEGGFVITDDDELYNVMLSLRSHGWDRDWDEDTRLESRKKYGISEFMSQYVFYYPGFNLRSTDLQAYIGLGQLGKLDSIVTKRNQNFNLMQTMIVNPHWKIKPTDWSMTSNFAYPILHPNRDQIVCNLPNMDSRPLIAGSMAKQPVFFNKYGHQELPNCERVHNEGFYVPNHHNLTQQDVTYIIDTVNKAIRGGQ